MNRSHLGGSEPPGQQVLSDFSRPKRVRRESACGRRHLDDLVEPELSLDSDELPAGVGGGHRFDPGPDVVGCTCCFQPRPSLIRLKWLESKAHIDTHKIEADRK
jgi:hypothetical protein